MNKKKSKFYLSVVSEMGDFMMKILKKNLKRIMVRDGICRESANRLKNSCSHFKLILYSFQPNIISHTNFHPNGMKNTKLKIFGIGQFWLVGLVGQKMVVGISNSFYVVFGPILAPIPNFIQIGRKTQK